MAVPKYRKSKSKVSMRRRSNDKRTLALFTPCPECGSLKLPHRICPACGMYKRKTIIKRD